MPSEPDAGVVVHIWPHLSGGEGGGGGLICAATTAVVDLYIRSRSGIYSQEGAIQSLVQEYCDITPCL